MRHLAGFSLTWASIFLAIVAILIGSPALFYITTALIATIGACHIQAYLSVRWLRLERVAPESVKVGDLVTIQINVWSLRKIKRTLITVWDNLPLNLLIHTRSPSLPIAPSYISPVATQYQFRPLKRGRYRWTGAYVNGTDALGLINKTRLYETTTAEMLVLPQALPLAVELPSAAGWGINESESGQNRGAGIEPRGIREYRNGDSIRQVHWRSTAKRGQLLVKEFEAGSQAAVGFCIQRSKDSEFGKGAVTTLEQMCGNVAFMAETFLRQGARVYLPNLDEQPSHFSAQERSAQIYQSLATVMPDGKASLAEDVYEALAVLPPASALYILVAMIEASLPAAISMARNNGLAVHVLLYDPVEFAPESRIAATQSAVGAEFGQELRSVGAVVTLTQKSVGEKVR